MCQADNKRHAKKGPNLSCYDRIHRYISDFCKFVNVFDKEFAEKVINKYKTDCINKYNLRLPPNPVTKLMEKYHSSNQPVHPISDECNYEGKSCKSDYSCGSFKCARQSILYVCHENKCYRTSDIGNIELQKYPDAPARSEQAGRILTGANYNERVVSRFSGNFRH